MSFKYTKEIMEETANIYIDDIIDISTVQEFEDVIDNIVSNNIINYIVIDMEKVQFIDSTGIGSIVKVISKLQDKGIEIKYINITEEISDIFDILGIFDVYEQGTFILKNN